jgi:hypothetical protein
MKQWIGLGLALVLGVLLLAGADAVMKPAPIASATAFLLGLIGLWLGGSEVVFRTSAGAVLGAAIGAFIHYYVHRSGGSPEPFEGVPVHIVGNAVLGLAVGAVLLLLVALLARGLAPRGYWRRESS